MYLLEDTLVTVGPDGRATERYRAVVKILRPQGRDHAHPLTWFTKDEKLESFHVWSIGPDGHHYAMKDSEYVETGDVGAAEGLLYADIRLRVASPPGADPDGVVAWEYVKQLPPYFAEDTWSFQNAVPTVRSVYEIDLPAGWHEEAVWSRHEKVAASEVAPGHFRWEQANIDGIDLSDVPLHPAWEALAGRMTVHFGADPLPEGEALWSKIGNWYYATGCAAERGRGRCGDDGARRWPGTAILWRSSRRSPILCSSKSAMWGSRSGLGDGSRIRRRIFSGAGTETARTRRR